MPKRTDANQSLIVSGLRAIGASVLDIHEVPGCFDILVGYHEIDYKMEIKSARGKLTPDEAEFHEAWKGEKVYVVRTLEQAIEILTEGEA